VQAQHSLYQKLTPTLADDIAYKFLFTCAGNATSLCGSFYLHTVIPDKASQLKGMLQHVVKESALTAHIEKLGAVAAAIVALGVSRYHDMNWQPVHRRNDDTTARELRLFDALEELGLDDASIKTIAKEVGRFFDELNLLAREITYIYLADRNESTARLTSFRNKCNRLVAAFRERWSGHGTGVLEIAKGSHDSKTLHSAAEVMHEMIACAVDTLTAVDIIEGRLSENRSLEN
jgi:hypothetical protein